MGTILFYGRYKIIKVLVKNLQIKIPIHLIYVFLFYSDVAEGDGGGGVVKNLLQHYDIVVLLIEVVAEGFA